MKLAHLALGLCLFILRRAAWAQHTFDSEQVTWTAGSVASSLALANILIAAMDSIPGITVAGLAPGETLRYANCRANFLRPGRGQGAVLHSENKNLLRAEW